MQYVIVVHCRNILLQENVTRIFGRKKERILALAGATTRVVTAANKDEACKLAIESAVGELKTNKLANDPSDPPQCEIDQIIREVGDHEAVIAPRKGFTFYPQEKNVQ